MIISKHLTLLRILNCGNIFISLIIDYLSERNRFVQIDNRKSTLQKIKFWVLQGSILGTTLLNIHVHDLSDQLKTSTIQFVDVQLYTVLAKLLKLRTMLVISRKICQKKGNGLKGYLDFQC